MSTVQRFIIITFAAITEFLILIATADAATDVAITEIDIDDATDASETVNLNRYCWNDIDASNCNIIGNFTRTAIGLSFPVNIECQLASSVTVNSEPSGRRFADQYLFQRFQGIEVISLNGCGVSAAHQNSLLGLQFIPDPASVRHLTLQMFKVNGALDATAFIPFKRLRSLILTNNRIERINKLSFQGLSALTELSLQENGIETIDPTAFEALAPSLDSLTVHENSLRLTELSPLPNLRKMKISVKELRWKALHVANQVASLSVVNVERVEFNVTSDKKQSFFNLTTLNVNFCHLSEMPVDYFPQMLYANFSHNYNLKNISLTAMQATQVQVLDISYNAFRVIDGWLLINLRYLEHFIATNNRIAAINPKAFQRNFYLKSVDIRFNQLKSLGLDLAILKVATELTFRIDDNPWNCAWVNKVSGDDPHIFSMKFRYEKRMERRNIRGLECMTYDDGHLFHSHLHDEDDQYHLTGERRRPQPIAPVEILRRNTKHTAMLTICILIVGVSGLLVSLYLFIRFRPLTSTLQPFYQTLPEQRKPSLDTQKIQCLDQRADIIRTRVLPPTDYESPLSNRLARFEIDGVELGLGLGLKDILRPMQSVDDDQFDDIEFKDLYEEIPDKSRGSNDERMPDKVSDIMPNENSDTQIN